HNKLENIDRTPAFGSEKYFNRLEKAQRRLSSQCWKARELQSSLRSQLADMQTALQSTAHLLDKSGEDGASYPLKANLNESVQDLQQLHRQFQRTLERLEVVEDHQLSEVKELQSMVATTEQLSVEHLQLRTESLIQHLSETHRKALRLEFTGATLALDRKQFSDIYKPLEQLLINAVVHGVEASNVRVNTGKNSAATITVAFELAENQLIVTVSDDGAGIDLPQLRSVAAQRASYDANMSDEALLRSIVQQGMSTSVSVDRSAGRGVGLDIVKEWVFTKQGEMSVSTQAGTGTTFTLTLPTVYESVPVMVVRQSGNLFAIDIEKISEIKERLEAGLSLGALTGLQTQNSAATLSCKTASGVIDLNVDAVIGRRHIKFVNEKRFLSAQRHYSGCGVIDNNQVVFRLDLNKLITAKAGMPLNAAPIDEPSASASVLIVDDSVTIRAAFGRAMQSAGYNIVLARNGLEAMEYLKANQPEVIILDLEMPVMDGYEVGSYIRNEPRLNRSALVIVSSKPKAVVGDWLTAVNADAYYEKPCSESAIAGLVAELV
ncbi:MAG: response regulator, partial [Pseudomonadota bacterium]